jgi:hypothetical protein
MNPQTPRDTEPLSIGLSEATATITDAALVLIAAAASHVGAVRVDGVVLMPTSRSRRMAVGK